MNPNQTMVNHRLFSSIFSSITSGILVTVSKRILIGGGGGGRTLVVVVVVVVSIADREESSMVSPALAKPRVTLNKIQSEMNDRLMMKNL